MEKQNKKKTSEAVIVTCLLFILSLPPGTPWWIAIIGIAVGVLFSKMVFGGFGRNPFNPAIAGRLFIYLTFPNHLTTTWRTVGNFGFGTDAVTGATSLGILRNGGDVDLLQHLLGMRTGSMGEGMTILILAAAVYLIWTKTAAWQLMASTLGSAFLLTLALDLANVPNAIPVIPAMFSGSLLFITVFMATEPITAPKKAKAKWVYGCVIGISLVLVRTFSLFPEGSSFAILLGNTFALLFDEIFTKKKKAAA